MKRNSIGGDMRKTQTVWTCDRCHKQVIGAPGTRKTPDGWQSVQVPVMAEEPGPVLEPILIVDAELCAECTRNLALWMKPHEV